MKIIHAIRTVKILLALLFFAVLAGVAVPNSSQAAKKGDYKYDTYKGGVKITEYTGKDKNVKIPDKIAGKKVVSIGKYAFAGNETMKKVTVPDTVEVIDNRAFASCEKLKKVHLGEKIKKIKYECFAECTKLLSINLENVEEIGSNAFLHDESITGVLNMGSVTTIGIHAFFGCEGIKEVNFTDTLQLIGRKDENENPFAGCTGIEKFTMSKENSNYMCVDGALYGKADNSVIAWPAGKAGAAVLGGNVKKIYGSAFKDAKITSITMEGEVNYIGDNAFADSMITQATLPLPDTSKRIDWSDSAFLECRKLEKVVFPDNSVSSNNICFPRCTSLREVVLPDTMTELSDMMFYGCTALKSITIPKSVTKIPMGCFYKCSRLKNVNLENIAEIGTVAFAHCSSLTGSLSLNAQKIGVLSFENCTNIVEIKFNKPLSKVLVHKYKSSYFGESDLEPFHTWSYEYDYLSELSECEGIDIDISKGKLQSNPFAGCTSLTSISVPEGGGLRSIDGVLYSADMKELVAFPAALTGRFNVPYGVENICSFAFKDSKLTELITANSVQNIYFHAVNGSSIKSITISKGVEYIEKRALDGCMQLESIKVHASNKQYESDDGVLYEKKPKDLLLLYPSARKGAKYTVRKKAGLASYSFDNCKYLKKVIMPEGVTRGNEIAFNNCRNIKLYLPKSMKSYKKRTYYRYDDSTHVYAFEDTCKGCRMYVKKNSTLAKYFDKNKAKYSTY